MLLKKLVKLSFTAVMVALFLFVMFVCGTARAERITSLKDGVYTEKEVITLKEIGGVPEGLSVEQVDSLVNGKIKEVTIEDNAMGGDMSFFFAFPLIKTKFEYKRRTVKYNDDIGEAWLVKSTSKFMEHNEYFATVMSLLMIIFCAFLIVKIVKFVNGRVMKNAGG